MKHTAKRYILFGYEYTGGGIPEDKQSRLFQRFAKLDDFTQGTGIGLAICKAIVDAQGGRIGVESQEGKGSTFWAWFPCEAAIVRAGGPDSAPEEIFPAVIRDDAAPCEQPSADAQPGKSILVAEDIDSNYLLVKAILKGCRLKRARTRLEAIELAAAHRFDAILMDMKMPVMDGIEAARRIRAFNAATPIIALTANASIRRRRRRLPPVVRPF